MIWVSHLLSEKEMKQVVTQTGMGIESIAFSIAENLDHYERTMQSYRRQLRELGCPSLTLHGPFLDLNPAAFDSLVREATLQRYEQTYQAAQELGAKKIIFHSGFVPSVYMLEGWAERMAEFWNQFLDGKPEEIQVLMENVLDPYPEPLQKTAKLVSHPAFGICLDFGHANCYSKVPCETWLHVLLPYLKHLHIHDNKGDRDSHMAAGEGTVPWKQLNRIFAEHGDTDMRPDGTIECQSAEEVLRTYRYIRQEWKSKQDASDGR